MKITKAILPAAAIVLAAGLAACGSTPAPAAAPAGRVAQTVIATPSATTASPAQTKTVTASPSSPQIVINNNAPAPVRTVVSPVYVAPALTACGSGTYGEEVYANQDTSCPFALTVEQDYANGGYWYQTGTSQFYSYSPVTGQSYLMTSSSVGNPVVVTGGDNALVQFNY
jgi:hypothetical protein